MTMFVKPKDGLQVRDPYTKRPIPVGGREVPDDSVYWNRRLAAGDVLLVPCPIPDHGEIQ